MTTITFNQLEKELAPMATYCGQAMSVRYLSDAMEVVEDFTPEDVRVFVEHWFKLQLENTQFLPPRLVSAGTLGSGLCSRRRIQQLDAAYPDDDDDAEGAL